MKAQEAFDQLKPKDWAKTPIKERIRLLKEVMNNLKKYADELALSDTKMKNNLMGEDIFTHAESKVSTAVPVSNTLTASIKLYESLASGKMLKPLEVKKVNEQIYDIKVFPQDAKDKILYGTQSAHLRVKGEPKQINPMDKPSGVIAVLGAGNYSSSLEMVKAMFFDNCAVIHKPHHINEETDQIWAKIFKPLIDKGALSFCASDQGKDLTQIKGLSKIYFTGGTGTAKAIMSATDTPLISECGGNNPCIVVPGDRPWTKKEMKHQAVQIITAAKLNGGAVCGRLQTLVTSKNWPQRAEFLEAIKKAISDETPAAGTYHPGSDKVMEGFKEAYPKAEILKPENGKYKNADFLFIEGAKTDGYAATHEAFCQIINEIPLDVEAKAETFLNAATEFCNNQLMGSLGCMIIIDEDTKKAHQKSLNQTVTNLSYGGIAVNTIPPLIFLSPYLTWGGNEEGKEMISGSGNFGNLLGFEDIEKSIIYDQFVSLGHMMRVNQKAFDNLATNMANFSMSPSWRGLTKMLGTAIVDGFRGKDF